MDKYCKFREKIQLTMNPIQQKNIVKADIVTLEAFDFGLGIGLL